MIYTDDYWPMQGALHQVESAPERPRLVIYLPGGQVIEVPPAPRPPLGFLR